MSRREPFSRRRASRTPSANATANVELVDGQHRIGICGDYIRHPAQPERQVA